ncbi:large ribosomal subunit protein eL21x/eL21w-like [Humulus lupulus]|uniref:large ribosomal subunit protein eL21x/eL21w-like n=1 Tax=Humulus lupulus TaxID=3486 RepID=UPI002B40D17C|nr:large ribosomal subunit protein eL21x/eL21w-like [Humulus lupulus]
MGNRVCPLCEVSLTAPFTRVCPNKFYHGRTGRVWNITKRAIGEEVNKQVGNRIIKKRIHVRVEHVQPSRCTEEFRNRKLRNDKLKAEAKLKGEAISTKRQREGPKPGFMKYSKSPRFSVYERQKQEAFSSFMHYKSYLSRKAHNLTTPGLHGSSPH